MFPSTWFAIVVFIILIAPGLFFDLLAQKRRVGPSESTFREASRVILASLVFSGAGFAIVGSVRAVAPTWMPDPGALFAQPHEYFAKNYLLVIRTLALEGVLALASAWTAHKYLSWKEGATLSQESSWQVIFRKDLPKNHDVQVQIRMTNGATMVGTVARFTADPEIADREIVLAPPIFVTLPGATMKLQDAHWQRVIVPASQIASIAVSYRPPSPSL